MLRRSLCILTTIPMHNCVSTQAILHRFLCIFPTIDSSALTNKYMPVVDVWISHDTIQTKLCQSLIQDLFHCCRQSHTWKLFTQTAEQERK